MNGASIKHYRSENHLTQQQLAYQCDVEVRTIQLIEQDRKEIGYHLAQKLSKVLKVDINSIDPNYVDKYHNACGYVDKTAGDAIKHVSEAKKQERDPRQEDVNSIMKALKIFAGALGFQICGRLVLEDKRTGRKYK